MGVCSSSSSSSVSSFSPSPTARTRPPRPTRTSSLTQENLAALQEFSRFSSCLNVSLYFGTQSGTAGHFARDLLAEFSSAACRARLFNLDEIQFSTIKQDKIAIFLVSTYGNGDPTDDARRFFDWLEDLRSSAPHQANGRAPLSGLKFAVFGLGSREYLTFCAAGERLDRLLSDLGGFRFADFGRGDAWGSQEGDFSAWKNKMWKKITIIAKEENMENNKKQAAKDTETPQIVKTAASDPQRFLVETGGFSTAGPSEDFHQGLLSRLILELESPQKRRRLHIVKCSENFVLHSKDSGTRQIEFSLTEAISAAECRTKQGKCEAKTPGTSTLAFASADDLGIFPRNSHTKTLKFLERLGRQPFESIKILDSQVATSGSKNFNNSFPSCFLSVYSLFSLYLDFQSKPRLQSLLALAKFCNDGDERASLMKLATEEKAFYLNNACTWDELFYRFPSLSVPLEFLIALLPPIQPRFYTIASSALENPRACKLAVKITKFPRKKNENAVKDDASDDLLTGLCSDFLENLRPGDEALVFVRPSAFRLPVELFDSLASSSMAAPRLRPPVRFSFTNIDKRGAEIPKSMPNSPIARTDSSGGGVGIFSVGACNPLAITLSALPPLIFIATGTGIAPFRAFLSDLSYFEREKRPRFSTTLYFGCRSVEKDFLFQKEFEAWGNAGILQNIKIAQSKPQGGEKSQHVQDLLKANEAGLWHSMQASGGYLFLCGSVALGNSIRDLLLACARRHGGFSHFQAEDWIKELERQKRFVQEIWG